MWLKIIFILLYWIMFCGSSASPTAPTLPLPEGWKTTKDAQGRQYYYHAATGQSSWNPPSTPVNVKAQEVKKIPRRNKSIGKKLPPSSSQPLRSQPSQSSSMSPSLSHSPPFLQGAQSPLVAAKAAMSASSPSLSPSHSEWESKVAALQQRLNASEVEHQRLSLQLNDLQMCNEELQKSNKALASEASRANSQVKERDVDVQGFMQELEEREEELRQVEERVKKNSGYAAALRGLGQALTVSSESLGRSIVTLRRPSPPVPLEDPNPPYPSAKIKKLKANATALMRNVTELRAAVADLADGLVLRDMIISDLETALDVSRSSGFLTAHRLCAEVSSAAERRYIKLEAVLAESNACLVEREAQLTDARATSAHHAELNVERGREIRELRDELLLLQMHLAHGRSTLAARDEALAAIRMELDGLRARPWYEWVKVWLAVLQRRVRDKYMALRSD